MKVHYDLAKIPLIPNAVITIGSFDGVHKGHQALIKTVVNQAISQNGESVLITFHPHPRSILFPNDNSLKLLNSIHEKLILIERLGIDHCVVIQFSKEFSNIDPKEYIESFLVQKFKPKTIVIGYDHKFGKNRAGNIDLLKKHAEKWKYNVLEIPKKTIDNITISSTQVRKKIQLGHIQIANELLGHPYTLSGSVIQGQKIGRSIGYPTANINLDEIKKIIPPDGVYVAKVVCENKVFQGMLYIGRRPTIPQLTSKMIEVNLLYFSGDLYEKDLSIQILTKIRNDKVFPDLKSLQLGLAQDRLDTIDYFRQTNQTITQNYQKETILAVVILNYNGLNLLQSFLKLNIHFSNHKGVKYFIIDNASTDKSVQWIKENFTENEIKIIQLSKNHGFAGGYNQGLKQIKAKYYALVNSDVLFSPNWFQPLVETLDHNSNIACIQPKIKSFYKPNQFEYAGAAGGQLDILGYPFAKGRIFDSVEDDYGQYDQKTPIFWASGACFLIRADTFNQHCGFDQSFFAHMEEIDLCWRIQRHGMSIFTCGESQVYHIGGGTLNYLNPRKTYLNFRNSLTMLLKNEKFSKLLWLFPLRLILDGIAGIKFLTEFQPKHTLAIFKAHFAVYKIFPTTLKQRDAHYNNPLKARYNGSIIVQYFLKGIKKYKNIK